MRRPKGLALRRPKGLALRRILAIATNIRSFGLRPSSSCLFVQQIDMHLRLQATSMHACLLDYYITSIHKIP